MTRHAVRDFLVLFVATLVVALIIAALPLPASLRPFGPTVLGVLLGMECG